MTCKACWNRSLFPGISSMSKLQNSKSWERTSTKSSTLKIRIPSPTESTRISTTSSKAPRRTFSKTTRRRTSATPIGGKEVSRCLRILKKIDAALRSDVGVQQEQSAERHDGHEFLQEGKRAHKLRHRSKEGHGAARFRSDGNHLAGALADVLARDLAGFRNRLRPQRNRSFLHFLRLAVQLQG